MRYKYAVYIRAHGSVTFPAPAEATAAELKRLAEETAGDALFKTSRLTLYALTARSGKQLSGPPGYRQRARMKGKKK